MTPTPRIIELCPEAWKLYEAWMAALSDHPIECAKVQTAYSAFREHRQTCPNCTPHAWYQAAKDMQAAFPETIEQAGQKIIDALQGKP
jgi:hypothetical protein